MSTNRRNARREHTGKSRAEKEAYGRFLRTPTPLDVDATVRDEPDTADTDTPGNNEPPQAQPRVPKSRWYRFKDAVSNNWGTTVIGGVIVGIVIIFPTLWIGNNREIGELKVSVGQLREDISKLQDKYEGISSDKSGANLNTDLQVFKANITADLRQLREKVDVLAATINK